LRSSRQEKQESRNGEQRGCGINHLEDRRQNRPKAKRNGQTNHDQQSAFLGDFLTASGKNNCTIMGDLNVFPVWRRAL